MAGTLEDGCTKARRGGRRAFEAEREGFEPSIEVDPLCRFSKPVPSASRPSLHERRNLTRSEGAVNCRSRPGVELRINSADDILCAFAFDISADIAPPC